MRTLTDTELHSVVGGDLESDMAAAAKFVTDACSSGDDSDVEEASAEITRPQGQVDAKVAKLGVGGYTIKVTVRCGPGGANQSEDGNDDGNEEEEKEDSKDK